MSHKINNRFSEFVKNELKKAGWSLDRNVSDLVSKWKIELERSDGFVLFPSAEKVLIEFGGIYINQKGVGETSARESLIIDPTLAIGENDRFSAFIKLLGINLYPLGEAGGGNYYLAIREDSRVFLLMNDIHLLGNSFDEALENLIKGVRTTPLNLWWEE